MCSFGKLYRIVFDKRNKEVVGADVTPYLLEKSRLCHQSNWERGFHIFYQMCYGLDDARKQELKMKPIHQYHYLNRHLHLGRACADDAPALEVDGDYCLFHVLDRSRSEGTGQMIDTNARGSRIVDDAENLQETLSSLRECNFSETCK